MGVPQKVKHKEIPRKYDLRTPQDNSCASGTEENHSELETIRSFRVTIPQEDEIDRIPDESEYHERRFRQLWLRGYMCGKLMKKNNTA